MARGGYRAPAKPSSVSGPGAKSRRTDGGPAQIVRDLTGGGYGEAKQFDQLQHDAPLANSQASTAPAGMPQGGAPTPMTPFDAPTQRPNEPVTAGNPLGPGPGPQGAGLAGGAQQANLERFRPMMPVLLQVANRPGTSDEFRNFVRWLKGSL